MSWEQIEIFERWLSVVGFEDLYEVSDWGRVRSTARNGRFGRLRKVFASYTGHLRVELSRENRQRRFYVHRLVADAFLGPEPNKEVDHIDGDPSNNTLPNLRYLTRSENTKAAVLRRGYWGPRGERQWCAKLTNAQRAEIPRLRMEGVTYAAIAAKFGVTPSTISDAFYRATKQSK